MAGFRELMLQYKRQRKTLIKSGADCYAVLRAADHKANKALWSYDRRNGRDGKERKICYNRAVNEIIMAIDILIFSRLEQKTPLLDRYLGG